MDNLNKKKVLFIVPLPPPYAGPEVSSKLLLEKGLDKHLDLTVVKSNIRSSNAVKGKFDIEGVVKFFNVIAQMIFQMTRLRPSTTYLLLSQNRVGFLRDTVYIIIAKILCDDVVVHLRGSNFRNFYDSSPFWLKFVIRNILEAVSILIVQDKRIIEQLKGLIDKKRIQVVPNLIDMRKVDAAEPENKKENVVLFVGHLSYAKGFYDFLCTIPGVVEECKDVKFWFLGERIDEEKNIMVTQDSQKIKQANEIWDKYSSHIKYFGSLPNNKILSMMKSASLLVLPSYSEGFPMAVLEAMACGIPVVTTDVGALASLVKEDVNGYLIKPGDTEALSEKVIKILKDKDLQIKIGNNNKDYVRDKFSAEKVVPVFAGIFSKLD